MRKINFFSIILFSLGVVNQVLACSCQRFTVEEQVDNAQWVFTATINKLELLKEQDDWGGGLIEIGFAKVEPIKGNLQSLTLLTTSTNTCGVDYEISRTYLIMADQNGFTNICTGTMQIVANENHLSFKVFNTFISEIKDYLTGKLTVIADFYNPITNRRVNSHQESFKSGCKQSGECNE